MPPASQLLFAVALVAGSSAALMKGTQQLSSPISLSPPLARSHASMSRWSSILSHSTVDNNPRERGSSSRRRLSRPSASLPPSGALETQTLAASVTLATDLSLVATKHGF